MSNPTTTAKQLEVQRIVDVLSKAIAQQRLRPGTRLVESQLVEALSANRNHVQVALQRLALQRIVTIEPNRGAMVAQPTAKEAREVFIARRAIERAIVECIGPDVIRRHRQTIGIISRRIARESIFLQCFQKIKHRLDQPGRLRDLWDHYFLNLSVHDVFANMS